MKRNAYVFLDSSFKVPQNIQLRIIQEFAKNEEISIDFYGNELLGYGLRLDQLRDKIKEGKYQHFIFFTLQQLEDSDGKIDYKVIESMTAQRIILYFAAQQIVLTEESRIMNFVLYHQSNGNKCYVQIHRGFLLKIIMRRYKKNCSSIVKLTRKEILY